MIKQAKLSTIDSRTQCKPYMLNEMLPLITAPMYSVVNETNYKKFIDNNINVCLPRNIGFDNELSLMKDEKLFVSCSLDDFINNYTLRINEITEDKIECICIDTANGNMARLHNAIIAAKKLHGSNLIIMAGNVASLKAFSALAKTGVDYIRVGIGGGSACTSTSNTGVGQANLEELISECYRYKVMMNKEISHWKHALDIKNYKDTKGNAKEIQQQHLIYYNNAVKSSNVKIVADGISTYLKQCQTKYGFNDNGYAAINKLLYAGADLIMIGSLFTGCLECAADKYYKIEDKYHKITQTEAEKDYASLYVYSKHYGMSTHKAQAQYKASTPRPSEGRITYTLVAYSLSEWLYGAEYQDEYPYLSGWVNSLQSAMSYTNSLTLDNFKQ